MRRPDRTDEIHAAAGAFASAHLRTFQGSETEASMWRAHPEFTAEEAMRAAQIAAAILTELSSKVMAATARALRMERASK